jgi:probable phosphoglycerate mutase
LTTGGNDRPLEDSSTVIAEIESILLATEDGEVEQRGISRDALSALTNHFFGERRPNLAAPPDHGSVTRIVRVFGDNRLASYNDTSTLDRRPGSIHQALTEGLPVIALIRHGQTAANVAGRWQGSMDEALDEIGVLQAAGLFEWYGSLETVWSSPLQRASATAAAIHAGPSFHEDLVELNFGNWEGLTTDEIRALHNSVFDEIFVDGSDHPRGETGETWAALEQRMWRAIEEIDPVGGVVTGIVTHGAAIRAVITSLTGAGWAEAGRVLTPRNTAVTHLILGPTPFVADYGIAPHLDEAD